MVHLEWAMLRFNFRYLEEDYVVYYTFKCKEDMNNIVKEQNRRRVKLEKQTENLYTRN